MMKPKLFLILFGLLSGFIHEVSCQDLSNFYTYRVQENGYLYFIFPFGEFNNTTDKSDFEFDITYRGGEDSATINFTYFTDDPIKADSFKFVNKNIICSGQTSRIFQDYKKKKWENRFGTKIAMDQLVFLFKSHQVPQIYVSGKDTVLYYGVKNKKWEAYANAVDKILYIIKPDDE